MHLVVRRATHCASSIYRRIPSVQYSSVSSSTARSSQLLSRTFLSTRFFSMSNDNTMSDVPAAASSSSVAPASSSSSAMEVDNMEIVYFCTLYGLTGWDDEKKLEKKLRAANVPFKRVFKKKGPREMTGEIIFDSEEQMNSSMAMMQELREAPTDKQLLIAKNSAANAAEAEAAAATSSSSSSSTPAVAPSTPLTRQLFKVRAPTSERRKRRAEPSANRFTENRQPFRAAKRIKIELKEGDVGYAEAQEEAKSDGEGEEKDGGKDESDGEGGGNTRAGRPQINATINDVVAPLWRKSYPEQLKIKRDEVKELIQLTTRNWIREYGKALSLPHQTQESSPIAKFAGKDFALFCPLDPIVPCEKIDAYRNKCEFSVGINEKNEIAIGHLMGKFSEGTVTVESIQDCPHVPDIAKSLSRTLQEFIQLYKDDYKTYSKIDHSGFWRLVCIRNSQETKQCMILIQVKHDNLPNPEAFVTFKQRLKEFFREKVYENPEWSAQNEQYHLRAIQVQPYGGVSNAAPEGTPIDLLYGEEASIHEKLMGLTFRVSQSAFFQINVPQTNKLYTIAADFASLPAIDAASELKSRTTLLDVCCGTGTIGLSLANRVGKIVGLEMSASAIEDAKYNAKLNGITNAFYYVGKAEDTISTALAEHVSSLTITQQQDHIVTAIVDPPRGGLHSDVVRLLRKCARIDRIVYISCNPKSLMDNLQRFCQPTSKKWVGPPFQPIRAVPVDMFPHTTHCEMIVLLERTRQPIAPPQGKTSKWNQPTKQFAHQMVAASSSSSSSVPPSAVATAPTAASAEEAKPEDTTSKTAPSESAAMKTE